MTDASRKLKKNQGKPVKHPVLSIGQIVSVYETYYDKWSGKQILTESVIGTIWRISKNSFGWHTKRDSRWSDQGVLRQGKASTYTEAFTRLWASHKSQQMIGTTQYTVSKLITKCSPLHSLDFEVKAPTIPGGLFEYQEKIIEEIDKCTGVSAGFMGTDFVMTEGLFSSMLLSTMKRASGLTSFGVYYDKDGKMIDGEVNKNPPESVFFPLEISKVDLEDRAKMRVVKRRNLEDDATYFLKFDPENMIWKEAVPLKDVENGN